MKKLLIGILSVGAIAMASTGSGPVITVNGKAVAFSGTQPQTITGRVMVPVRGVFEAIGAYVEYDPVMHQVKAKRANESIELKMGDKVATRNGAEIELEVPPMAIHGRMMVPLRFIAESLGSSVNFDKTKNEVQITTNEDLPGVKPPPPTR